VLKTVTKVISVESSTVVKPAQVEWADFAAHPVQFVKLELRDKAGKLLSENFYWQSHPDKPEELRALETLPKVVLNGKVSFAKDNEETVASVELTNPGKTVALMTHLVLRNAGDGTRILPAYASDNYVNLLPGENKTIAIRCANNDPAKTMSVSLDGWNVAPANLTATK
jgi:beta-mannosidase